MLKRLILRNYPQGGFDLMLVDKTILRYLLRGGPLVMPQLTAFWLGFQPTIIYGERPPRPHGKSTFTFAKRLKFFVDTVTTFSVVPIRFFSAVGLITALMSLAYGSYIFVNATLGNFAVQGFATLVVLISFFSGLILMMLGIIGEYLWRIVSALDDRPESVVEESRL
jgi:dolichol-phosphate mannosyltransferase